jgi:hypothetical protein
MRRMFCIISLFVTQFADAQVAKIVPPQTPRQAILEVITAKDNTTIERHLPEATRKFWASRLSSLPSMLSQGMAMTLAASRSADFEGEGFTGISVTTPKPDPNLETFQAGPVLLRYQDPRTQTVQELRVDQDDLNSDEATMELSLHQTSAEGEDLAALQFPSIRLHMKLEAGIWRFEEVAFVQRLRLGDPQFAKATARQESQQSEYVALAAITTLVTAEKNYLRQSPNKEFTCSVAQLASSAQKSETTSMIDATLRMAEAKGYKIQLSNCDGSGFRIAAVPQQRGKRVLCGDESETIKGSAKGVADCFANGQQLYDLSGGD